MSCPVDQGFLSFSFGDAKLSILFFFFLVDLFPLLCLFSFCLEGRGRGAKSVLTYMAYMYICVYVYDGDGAL